ncbi:MAG: class II aldolase/adducin family protein [Lachnospirales bacterium]
MTGEYEIKKQILDVGRRIYNRGMVAANDGNISVKLNDNEFLCTPTGVSKGFMTMDMICKVDAEGKVISANGPYRPSSEIKMHMRVYKLRPDVKSVVHAHPVYATAFAIAGIPLTQPIMPEAVISLGCVPIAPYGTPSTMEIPDAVEPYLEHFDAVLLENHGALSFGDSLMNAYFKMESLEFYAKLLMFAKQLGGPKELSDAQVQRLYEIRKKLGMTGKHPANLCQNMNNGCHAAHGTSCGSCNGSCSSHAEQAPAANDDLVAEITKRILAELNK